jgi:type IV pilus assembly protein PilV
MQNNLANLPSNKQFGFSMIEILVTLVIVATALLGTAGLQAYAMRMGKSSEFRTQAVFLASDIAERMEANKRAAVLGGYVVAATSSPSASITTCETGTCDMGTLATYDISKWENTIASLLPQASWQIAQTTAGNPSTYVITISWTDRRTDTNYAAYNATSSVGINATGTGERFSYTTTRNVIQ